MGLAPVQCRLVPVNTAVADYVEGVAETLRTAGLRVEVASGAHAGAALSPDRRDLPRMDQAARMDQAVPQPLLLLCLFLRLLLLCSGAGVSVGKAIRAAEKEKIPVMCVIGQREALEGTVAVRTYSTGDMGSTRVEDLVARLVAANSSKTTF